MGVERAEDPRHTYTVKKMGIERSRAPCPGAHPCGGAGVTFANLGTVWLKGVVEWM